MRIRGGSARPCLGGERPYVRVGIRDERKILGIGEATPWPTENASAVSSMAMAIGNAFAELERVDLDELPVLEALTRALAPVETLLAPWKTARFALETALLDVVGQRLGQPIAECLSSEALAEVPCNALLDASKDDLVHRAGELAMQGLAALKVKLRARDKDGFAREVHALREMRQVWPGELRLDPNGVWGLEEARKKIAILAEFEPRYVEQPVAAEHLGELGKTACPWAADESLLIPGLPERLIEAGTCAAFVLKPALLGGLSPAMQLANLARSAGILTVTTHALDGPVGIAAAVEFARAVSTKSVACGLDLHSGLVGYPQLVMPHHARAGYATRANKPGLGFSQEDRQRWLTGA